ncbi:uncharacterized protein YhfF [Crossiella equi]|uniref:Uncharacterized protein YhfF n=1 Tax=Crossiella equi TaxID=130796 RepID=A0ABS5AF69_9PSEU|nr:ASCH domain-containing protein [Crossiella equi]MBP2475229.1 uncharacterized protein YhfF [Crossiella equi]
MAWPRCDGKRVLGLGVPGEQRDWLNDCVLNGNKRATAGLLETDYEPEGEALEHVGELLALVDSEDGYLRTVEVTHVSVVPFGEVPFSFAEAEGEGFRSIEHWREAHAGFWAGAGATVTPESAVALIHFRVLDH